MADPSHPDASMHTWLTTGISPRRSTVLVHDAAPAILALVAARARARHGARVARAAPANTTAPPSPHGTRPHATAGRRGLPRERAPTRTLS